MIWPNTDTDHSDQSVPVLFAPLFLEGRHSSRAERPAWKRRGGQRGGRGRSGCRAAGRSAGNLEHLTWEDHVRVMHHGSVGLVEQAPIGRVAVKPLRYGGQRVARPDCMAAGRLMVNDQGIGDGGQRAARSDRRAAARLMKTGRGAGVCLLDDHYATDRDLGGRGRVRGGDKHARDRHRRDGLAGLLRHVLYLRRCRVPAASPVTPRAAGAGVMNSQNFLDRSTPRARSG